jgi:hypothetical protein
MPAVYVFHGEPASLPMAWFYVGRGPAELGLMQLTFSCTWQRLPGGLSHDSSSCLRLQDRPNSDFPGLLGLSLHAGTLSVFATLMALTVLPYPPTNPEMVVWTFTLRCAHIVPALQHAQSMGKIRGLPMPSSTYLSQSSHFAAFSVCVSVSRHGKVRASSLGSQTS